jgi:hypothetical protein
VGKAGAIRGGRRPFGEPVVLEDLKGWSVVAESRQSQMNPLQVGIRYPGGEIEPGPSQVPCRWHRSAAEDLLIETGEAIPVLGDEVCVDKSGIYCQGPITSLRNTKPRQTRNWRATCCKALQPKKHAGINWAILLEKATDSK